MDLYNNLSAKIYLMEKHFKENGQKEQVQPWYLSASRRADTFSRLKLGFYKTLLALVRLGLILRGKPASNFTVFTRAGKDGLYICNYSYCYYKDFHHKTRNKTLATIVAATVILSLLVSLIFPGEPRARAAVYNWNQADWSGGGSALTASHTANQTGWTKYATGASASILGALNSIKLNLTNTSWTQTDWTGAGDINAKGYEPTNRANWTNYSSKDTNVDITTTPGSITESLQSGTTLNWIQTSNTDFNAGAISDATKIKVSGTGSAADLIFCDYNHNGADWTPANGSSIDGVHCGVGTFTIASGYTVYVTAYNGTTYGKLSVYANSATITGTLSATGKGYAAGSGPGAGGSGGGGGGGGHGGGGGGGQYAAGGPTYGSITAPNDLGSGGGYDG
ncbi:hypothetical protein KJ575_02300, partial [Patescibacteria group bacterium]|nr:hypothetical protein [Patescibacteria group bacterium]